MDSDKAPFDPSRIESINSLETARMALRWALERLATLERLNAEYVKKAEWEFKMRLKAEEDFKTQLEVELAHAEDTVRLRAKQAAKAYTEKLASIEAEHAAELAAARQRAQETAYRAELGVGQTKTRLEEEYNRRLAELRPVEDRLRRREADLSERENEFERFCSAQKGQAEADLRRIEAETQSRALQQAKQTRLEAEERFATLQASWERERSSLAVEALARMEASWREDLQKREAALADREAALKAGSLKLLRHYRAKRAQIEKLKAQAASDLAALAKRIDERLQEKPPRGETKRPDR